jgi:hypothetical protein
MDDEQIWAFEDSLWRADEAHYRASIDDACLMIVAAPPYVMTGEAAVEAVSQTRRWEKAAFSENRISRPGEGLIVIAYRLMAEKPGTEPYDARCTSTYLQGDNGNWTVIQHQQAPVLAAS